MSANLFAALFLALSGPASAGIADTKHNLGTSNGRAENKSTSTDEICVFCHTPHGADVTAPAPLWNKKLPTVGPTTYRTYDQLQTPSLDGTIAPVGSVSLACLSCHDGTQAMDNIINAPGSGNYDPTGGGAGGLNWAWSGPRVDSGTGTLNAGVALLTTDLRDDHPIGIQYCGGGLAADGTTANCKDQDFKRARSASINGNTVFWVDTGGAGGDNVKHRTDLPLYVRPDNVALGPLVECASCHDPHVSEGQTGPNSQVAGATFLRIANTGSAVCTSCHVK